MGSTDAILSLPSRPAEKELSPVQMMEVAYVVCRELGARSRMPDSNVGQTTDVSSDSAHTWPGNSRMIDVIQDWRLRTKMKFSDCRRFILN